MIRVAVVLTTEEISAKLQQENIQLTTDQLIRLRNFMVGYAESVAEGTILEMISSIDEKYLRSVLGLPDNYPL